MLLLDPKVDFCLCLRPLEVRDASSESGESVSGLGRHGLVKLL